MPKRTARDVAAADQAQARNRDLDRVIYRALLAAIAVWGLVGGIALLMLAGWLPMPDWAAASK